MWSLVKYAVLLCVLAAPIPGVIALARWWRQPNYKAMKWPAPPPVDAETLRTIFDRVEAHFGPLHDTFDDALRSKRDIKSLHLEQSLSTNQPQSVNPSNPDFILNINRAAKRVGFLARNGNSGRFRNIPQSQWLAVDELERYMRRHLDALVPDWREHFPWELSPEHQRRLGPTSTGHEKHLLRVEHGVLYADDGLRIMIDPRDGSFAVIHQWFMPDPGAGPWREAFDFQQARAKALDRGEKLFVLSQDEERAPYVRGPLAVRRLRYRCRYDPANRPASLLDPPLLKRDEYRFSWEFIIPYGLEKNATEGLTGSVWVYVDAQDGRVLWIDGAFGYLLPDEPEPSAQPAPRPPREWRFLRNMSKKFRLKEGPWFDE